MRTLGFQLESILFRSPPRTVPQNSTAPPPPSSLLLGSPFAHEASQRKGGRHGLFPADRRPKNDSLGDIPKKTPTLFSAPLCGSKIFLKKLKTPHIRRINRCLSPTFVDTRILSPTPAHPPPASPPLQRHLFGFAPRTISLVDSFPFVSS